MTIAGSLRTMPITELLMWISQHQKSGMLRIRTEKGDQRIGFDEGQMIYSSTPNTGKTLGQLLIAKGILTEEVHEKARRLREESGVGVAKILADLKVLPEEEILRFLQKKAESELFELFDLKDGEFEFDQTQVPQINLLPMRLDVSKALLRVSQQIDENEAYDFDSSGIRWATPPN